MILRIVYIFSILILSFFTSSLVAQEFYAMDKVQTIEIEFAENNWDQLLDAAYASTSDYILAQSVTINGEVFDSVGVKYKGNSTYNPNQDKNPFHIELDTYKDQKYENYTDIKLSNIAKDPSFLREVLSYDILRKYMDAPLSNYANVYINGDLIGIYSNSEAVSKKFIKSRFGSNDNVFVKCNPPAGAGPQANDFPSLEYLGTDSTNYYEAYEIKSEYGWGELIDFCDTLNNQLDQIETVLDVDRALWMLAYNNALVNLDSYIGGFKQNYYLYRDDYGRFLTVVWDLNESFGKFAMSGSGNLNSTNAKQTMDPLLHENDSDFPLISKLLSVPQYKRMYIAHYKTILEENFANSAYYNVATELATLIDADVQADPNKLFSYDNFLNNLDSDVSSGGGPGGPGGGSSPGIANLMDGRQEYLLGLDIFTTQGPGITNISQSEEAPVVGQPITINADISNSNLVILNYRTKDNAPFTKVEMYDDGSHNDGQANDGRYGVDIPIDKTVTQYYIYAENDDAGMFSPQRAEHEFYSILATNTTPPQGDLVINELLASNDSNEADQDGEFDDWIELYNNGNQPIDLSGYMLSDDIDEPSKWVLPEGTTIESGEYLIIWADNDEDQTGLHAAFKLSAAGESLLLSDRDGMILDEVTFIDQETDLSYGRYPNGTGNFQTMTPTFNSMNSNVTSISEIELNNSITVYPNPSNHRFEIISKDESMYGKEGIIYNLDGKMIDRFVISNNTSIDATNWVNGIYILKTGGSSTKLIKL